MDKRSLAILLLTFSCLSSLAFCRPIVDKTQLDIKAGAGADAAGVYQSNPRSVPWPHWEYTSSPTDGGPPRWRFVYPPIPATPGFTFPRSVPWPHWEYVQPPGDLPHWQFVYPGMPSTPAPAA